ncbi:SufD family Fe-S cluster assembly protein [Sphingosinicella sp. BN140058]|uniref:SufB/SufD family protein n=1 Tax=Sphingosinicella sp. BN140058 TaxID=1892855 RepID=UPI001011C2CD|nr:SufD family Fe-S cluster assembly protein [Sphingosinicella sp. BN140058]QAY76965.1 SufD family Fe-S cluster assembly protein [Sphingosinicella sp. BN140058]
MSLLELPSPREEAWRWSDLSALPEIAARAPTGQMPAQLPWLDCATPGPRLLFVDGRLDAANSVLGPITIGPLDTPLGSHALARLIGGEGWTLRLAGGHAPLGLVQVIHVSTGAADHLPARIELDVDSQASVVETFLGDGWANRLTHVTLYRGARLMLSRRILTASGYVSLADRVVVGEGASFVLTTLAAGAADTRLDGEVRLAGDAGFAEVGGALLARGRQRHDANLVIRHEQPNGQSRQVWRSVADDQATCSVAARVEVARGAQKTDGEQSLKGLLLSRTGTINSKPELEIFADDVKCAHGATVGELNRDALFYLASRGIPRAEAKALLTASFVADSIERIGEEDVRTAFLDEANAWLGREEDA